MNRYSAIQNALVEINDTIFQELCDAFILLRHPNYAAFSRTGSQSGKQKTTVGTPDSFFLLPNGKYLFVEHTTISSGRVSKLKDDITKCLNVHKTGIVIRDIAEIILCTNFNLKTEEVQELKDLLGETSISLTIHTLDSLSLDLFLNHRNLVHCYLGLPLDTGQVVSLHQFVEEYNRAAKGAATPLDNIFLHRGEESRGLMAALAHSDFIIVTGGPGVGKTKLVIETINNFIAEHRNYRAYCVSYKSHALLDDLYEYFPKQQDSILFVDDANRIDAFQQILGFYKSTREGALKVIITVRDYAYQEIARICQDFAPYRLDVEKLTDEHITDIIKSDSYNIRNPDFQKEIVRIADGNPRLAIMTAKLALEKQNIHALSDVSDLFERYFSTFVFDKGELEKVVNFQCLGLIAFFHTLPYKDKETISPILENFGLRYEQFIASIDSLEKMELVEVQYDYVKIGEQNLANYFFYRTFVRDHTLSFEQLLAHYFASNPDRFRDCVIPANNTFGPQRVMEKLRPALQGYWNHIKGYENTSFVFFSTFWYYLQVEALEFVYGLVEDLPEPVDPAYSTDYQPNDFSFRQSKAVELLGDLMRHPDTLKDALQLGFEFVRRAPQHLPELIHKLRQCLTFDKDDEPSRFWRQEILFEVLLARLTPDNSVYFQSFYALAKTFLGFAFHQTRPARRGAISIYDYPIPNTMEIKAIRAQIWQSLGDSFAIYPHESFQVLKSYSDRTPDVQREIMQFDLPFVLGIIEFHLTNASLEHCHYVQEQLRWFKRNVISHEAFASLGKRFTNPTYEIYRKIDWNLLRNREEYEYNDFDKYELIKEREIREYFAFHSLADFEYFYRQYQRILDWKKQERFDNRSIQYVIDESLTRDFALGCQILTYIIEAGNEILFDPLMVFHNHLKEVGKARAIWELMQHRLFHQRSEWELFFFYSLSDQLVNTEYAERLPTTISRMQEPVTLNLNWLEKYLRAKPDLFHEIIRLVTDKIEKEKIAITIWPEAFSKHFDWLGKDLELIARAYQQQDRLQSSFDRGGEGFVRILRADPGFLHKYIQALLTDKRKQLARDQRRLSGIWSVEGVETILDNVFEHIVSSGGFSGIGPHFCNCFFSHLQPEWAGKADTFVMDYIRRHHSDAKKINVIIDVVRHSRKHLFDQALLLFVTLNQDVKSFSNIWWRGNGGTYSGDVIIGDIQAAEWRNILSVLETSTVGIRLIPIKKYVHDHIQYALSSGDRERQRNFLERR
jgi:hypothetical protein